MAPEHVSTSVFHNSFPCRRNAVRCIPTCVSGSTARLLKQGRSRSWLGEPAVRDPWYGSRQRCSGKRFTGGSGGKRKEGERKSKGRLFGWKMERQRAGGKSKPPQKEVLCCLAGRRSCHGSTWNPLGVSKACPPQARSELNCSLQDKRYSNVCHEVPENELWSTFSRTG